MTARQAPDKAFWVLAAQTDQEFAIVAENSRARCSFQPMVDILRDGLGQVFAFPADEAKLDWLKKALKDTMIQRAESDLERHS